jgi:hypothetical protein
MTICRTSLIAYLTLTDRRPGPGSSKNLNVSLFIVSITGLLFDRVTSSHFQDKYCGGWTNSARTDLDIGSGWSPLMETR